MERGRGRKVMIWQDDASKDRGFSVWLSLLSCVHRMARRVPFTWASQFRDHSLLPLHACLKSDQGEVALGCPSGQAVHFLSSLPQP